MRLVVDTSIAAAVGGDMVSHGCIIKWPVAVTVVAILGSESFELLDFHLRFKFFSVILSVLRCFCCGFSVYPM